MRLLCGFLAALFLLGGCKTSPAQKSLIHEDFVSLHEIDPTIPLEIRYFGDHNFIGHRVRGYLAPKCILTRQAAAALARIQADLKTYSLTLKVYDCYRPQRAVQEFVEWAKNLDDVKMRKEFYPNVKKTDLFKDGYIAEKSGHSRGSTVDLTLVSLPVPSQVTFKNGSPLVDCFGPAGKRFQDNSLDMGTGFDCFDPLAHTANPQVGKLQQRNRLLLKAVMEKHGFVNLAEEWWHFTLKSEPFPDRYFDFEVQ